MSCNILSRRDHIGVTFPCSSRRVPDRLTKNSPSYCPSIRERERERERGEERGHEGFMPFVPPRDEEEKGEEIDSPRFAPPHVSTKQAYSTRDSKLDTTSRSRTIDSYLSVRPSMPSVSNTSFTEIKKTKQLPLNLQEARVRSRKAG